VQPIKFASGKKKEAKVETDKAFISSKPLKSPNLKQRDPKGTIPLPPAFPGSSPSSNAAGQAQFLSCGKIRFR
jgi:hypothetical protein